MASSNSFFKILILFAFYVFPLLVQCSPEYRKPRARKGLAKRAPEDDLCADNEEWNERRCNGAVNELAWTDHCWNAETEQWVEHGGECEGGYVCTDTEDDAGDLVIECIESDGDIVDPGENEGLQVQNDAVQNWQDGDIEEEHDGAALWGGAIIDMGGGVPPNPDNPGIPYEVVRFMNTTIMAASVTAALLSHSEDFIVLPHTPLTVTRGNLNTPLCTYSAAHRRCEPTEKLDLWHGDRITVSFSLISSQAVFLVLTYFGPKAHAPGKTHPRLLFDRATD